MWQDIVLMIGGLMFAVALIPSIIDKRPPSASSSLITGVILFVFCAVYISLGLKLAFAGTLATSILWMVLYRMGRANE